MHRRPAARGRGLPMGLVHVLVLFSSTIIWFLVAAKTHGRQIRLEREYRGIDDVDFRRATANHPWVEELWKQDRTAYWTRAATIFVPLLVLLLFLDRFDLGTILAFSILFAMGIAFTTQAFQSQRRLHHMLTRPPEPIGPNPRHDDARWKADARRGTWIWTTATYALMVATFAATYYAAMS